MFIDDKELQNKLGKAECDGVMRARKTLAYIHQWKATKETDPMKRGWHEKEYKRLLDDNLWNLLDEESVE